eukprot:1488156-Amphidinium_carterae.1
MNLKASQEISNKRIYISELVRYSPNESLKSIKPFYQNFFSQCVTCHFLFGWSHVHADLHVDALSPTIVFLCADFCTVTDSEIVVAGTMHVTNSGVT